MAKIIDSDWLKFKTIQIGLNLKNFEKSDKIRNFYKMLRILQFLIFFKIVHCYEFFGISEKRNFESKKWVASLLVHFVRNFYKSLEIINQTNKHFILNQSEDHLWKFRI